MKVRAIRTYNDLQLNRMVNVGEELDVTEDRADQLIIAKVCEEIPTTTPTVEKKRRVKK